MSTEIKYPMSNGGKPINIDQKMECALSHPTFEEGLNWLMVDEHERALASFQATGSRDTCFFYLINRFTELWKQK